jgi:uroporphyrinogen-III decarboxylase
LHREGGAVQAILDLADYPAYLAAVRDRYAEYLKGLAEAICVRTPVEGLFLNCGSASLNIVSPALFAEWDLPVVRAVAAVARRRDKIMHYHLHGRGRALLDGLVEAGVTMICPLESPPKGDFLLREVKERFGGRLALKGGVDPFLLRDGGDAELESQVRRSLEEAAAGGGFTLATGDGVLKDTPFERIRRLVELARRFGAY